MTVIPARHRNLEQLTLHEAPARRMQAADDGVGLVARPVLARSDALPIDALVRDALVEHQALKTVSTEPGDRVKAAALAERVRRIA